VVAGPWSCPVCRHPLLLDDAARTWRCAAGHTFDVARQGYVNLVRRGTRRASGDSVEMVRARQAFLATGAYDRVGDAVNAAVANAADGGPVDVLDVGCGEGYYTRRLTVEGRVAGVDLSRPAVAAAARQQPGGWYAVASAFDLPVPDRSVDVLISVFGPVAGSEFARVGRPGGAVIAVHPGPRHLDTLRALVYEEPVAHETKDPLRQVEAFRRSSSERLSYALTVPSAEVATQLLTMTPYRWHAGRDIQSRLDALGGLDTQVDVFVSTYRLARAP
jgi:23S rRNA (guanine745-N1)-methyltransferase